MPKIWYFMLDVLHNLEKMSILLLYGVLRMTIRLSCNIADFYKLNDFLTSINYLEIGIEISNSNCRFVYFSMQFYYYLLYVLGLLSLGTEKQCSVCVQCTCVGVGHWMDCGDLNSLRCRSCPHTLCEAAVFMLTPEPGVHRTGRWEDACKAGEQHGTVKSLGWSTQGQMETHTIPYHLWFWCCGHPARTGTFVMELNTPWPRSGEI